ncbi:hypothetical protein PENSPDRAFT_679150 [Peniophora sp. CONT]|nr:hypothetical protein PENSPDRAFT_679150 [Peniophora sp. CONT]
MPKDTVDETLDRLASKMFNAMLDDILMDVALQSHQEVARSKAVCEVCHTRCRQQHVPGTSDSAGGTSASSSMSFNARALAVSDAAKTRDSSAVYLPCKKCDREIASNRYASHFSSCLGTGTSRKAAQKPMARSNSDAGSPFASENGDAAEEYKPPTSNAPKPKPKGRPPKNKSGDDAAKKRQGSPQMSPSKSKKQKTSTLPLSRVTSTDSTMTAGASQPKAPSRLRETSIFGDDSRSPSPALAAITGKSKQREASPPRPALPAPPVRRIETDYLLGNDDGDETGSSTDTDGSG